MRNHDYDAATGTVVLAPQQDSSLRSRLRRPPSQSSEFPPLTRANWIITSGHGEDHSADVPDHAEPSPCRW
jgi:hypothetical protein